MRTNSNTLKITYLLAQYLYSKKQLDLPGIGSFQLDPSVEINTEGKQQQPIPDGITFQNNPAKTDVKDLIDFISTETGKMKALASADLDSQLQLALQFLNMGKPYTFEGIGTLTKLRANEYEFTPGAIIPEKIIKESGVKDKQPVTSKDSVEAKYQTYLSEPEVKPKWKKPVVALLILAGIAITIWAGYAISNRNAGEEEPQDEVQQFTATPAIDSTAIKDSIAKANQPPQTYKYVLEIAKRNRAIRRYNQLKDNRWDVQMETKDSLQYKLFMNLPASLDTTRTLDSLMVLSGKKVYIEHLN